MGTWLLAAALQLQTPPGTPPGIIESSRPRFSIGADFGMGIANGLEGGGILFGGGVRGTVPLTSRDSLNLRVMHVVPELSGGMYEVRWQRHVNWPGAFQPDYAGVGAVGFYWLEWNRSGVKANVEGATYPLVLSLTAGWQRPIASRLQVPFELSVYAHPYGLVAAAATVGVTWAPARSAR